MEKAEKEPWVTYLEGDVIYKEAPAGHRVYQLVVRVSGEGLQAVIKARRDAEYFVVFTGAASLSSLAAKVRGVISNPDTLWRPDKYKVG